MKKLITICVIVGLILMNAIPATAAITMTFEEFIGFDGAPTSTFYSGITFSAVAAGSPDWVAADTTTGSYNASSWPSGSGGGEYWIYDSVSTWTGVSGAGGKISFGNANATFVEVGYSAATTLNLEAYDSGGFLLDSDSGPANLRYINSNPSGPGTLRVDWDGTTNIAYVLIHDLGNYWTVDNISTDATGITGIIPAPGAILLGSIGVSLVGWLRRRRTL